MHATSYPLLKNTAYPGKKPGLRSIHRAISNRK